MSSEDRQRGMSTHVTRLARTMLERLASAIDRFRHLLFRQEWFNSVLMPAIPRRVRWSLRRLYFLLPDMIESALGKSDELIPPKSKIFVGTVDFKEGAQEGIDRLIRMDVIAPESRVLDIGCGIGRLAIPLTRYLKSGSYDGLDIVPSGIDWCNEHIAGKYPNFHFTLADVFNKEYNPGGHVSASDYTFPYPDDAFDLVLLISVFTHMLPEDTHRYIAEISPRVAPRGALLGYLLHPELRVHRDDGDRKRIPSLQTRPWGVLDRQRQSSGAFDWLRRGLYQRPVRATRPVARRWDVLRRMVWPARPLGRRNR